MTKKSKTPTRNRNTLPAKKSCYVPTDADKATIKRYLERREIKSPAPRVTVQKDEDGAPSLMPDHTEHTLYQALLAQTFGSVSKDFYGAQVDLIVNAITKNNEVPQLQLNSAFAAMYWINPQDEIEAMLGAQMVAVHHAAMSMARSLNNVETIDQQNSASNALNKLMRTYTAQMEALNRHRGKGQQKMTIEHVHVHDGGQAIVGNVQGGGGKQKKDVQPRAKAANA